MSVARMRMFAGPNGSGKSTLKTVLPPELLGVYLNPDDIEKSISSTHILDLSTYNITVDTSEVSDYFRNSVLFRKGETTARALPVLIGNIIEFNDDHEAEYQAASVTEFLRQQLVRKKVSFTFETVMSHPSKIDFLRYAKAEGFRTYLYYIATSDPIININRVNNRVLLGGHAVTEDKIRTRYERSLGLLADAIRNTDRAYIFDNSIESVNATSPTWIAEITGGKELILRSDSQPAWFKAAVLENF